MKKLFLIIAVLFSVAGYSQRSNWKEYKEFYKLVKLVLHPAEYEDLKPVKDSAGLLLAKARSWQQSKIPSAYDAELVKKGLAELVAMCNDLNNAVIQKKDDETLSLLAIKVHNKFHYIAGRLLK